jgi:hypothetical protein
MDNKLLLIFILLFLSFLLLFYYLKLKTNIIMLLSIIIVLCINKLIVQKEYFTETDYIRRDLINYMLNYKGDEDGIENNSKLSLSFYGSEQNPSSTLPTKKNEPWQTVLTNILNLLKFQPTKSANEIPNIPFIKSIEPSTT